MILGITGTDGAGKGTVVDYLVTQKGFTHYSARALFVEEIERRQIENSRANMRIVANELRAQYGDDFLVTHYLEQIKLNGTKHAVIESIRAAAEAEALKDNGGVLLAVDADQKLRYERIQKRRSSSDQISFDAFIAHEALEMHDPDPHGMQKAKVIEMANYVIMNNGTQQELEHAVDAFLSTCIHL